MATQMDGTAGAPGIGDGNAAERLPGAITPFGSRPHRRRRHGRSKHPWRSQRRRRKLIQITLVSSLALLFLVGVLYMAIVSSRPTSSSDTRLLRAGASAFAVATVAGRELRCCLPSSCPDHV